MKHEIINLGKTFIVSFVAVNMTVSGFMATFVLQSYIWDRNNKRTEKEQ
jgi:hypothetical protein